MKHYWFEVVTEGSDLEGENFLVGAATSDEAYTIANEYFEGEVLACYGPVSGYEAECSGLDEY